MQEIKKKELLQNTLLVVISLLVCFAVLEVVFRVFSIEEVHEIDSKYIKHSTYNPFLIFGPALNKRIMQDGEITYWSNSQGFRMRDDLPFEKGHSEYRIIALGGSTTQNGANRMDLHYPEETSKILNSKHFTDMTINIVNSGKAGYSSAHSLIRLQFDILPFEPNMVTVMHNINDLTVNFFPYSDETNNYRNKYLHETFAIEYDDKQTITRKSRVFVFIDKSLDTLKNRIFGNNIKTNEGIVTSTMKYTEQPIELKAKNVFRNNLIAISRIAKAHNITPVFLSQPAIFTEKNIALAFGHKLYNNHILYPTKEELQKYFEEYSKIIQETAEAENIHFIDMYELMDQDEMYFVDMSHYNAKGIHRFSEILAEELEKIIAEAINE
jgi:lysophospholipase L1-like esterase